MLPTSSKIINSVHTVRARSTADPIDPRSDRRQQETRAVEKSLKFVFLMAL